MGAQVAEGTVEDGDASNAVAKEVGDEPLDSGYNLLRGGGIGPTTGRKVG